MTGAELKLLCTLNNVKAYDIANNMGISHGTMTRLCQPSRELEDGVTEKILRAMREVKGGDIVTSVSISDVADILKTLD